MIEARAHADVRPAPSPLGDALRAFAALRPSDERAGKAIVEATGVVARRPAPTRDDRPLDVVPDAAPIVETPLAPPRVLDDGGNETLPPIRDAALEALEAVGAAAPAWLTEVPLIPTAATVPNPFRAAREPLFEPKWQRTIVTRIASALLPVGALDVDAVIAAVSSARPVERVPRTRIRTAVHGVLVLIDEGDSMQPFRQDTADLVRTLQRVIGASRLRVAGFHGLPTFGVTTGLDWTAWKPAMPGMATVIVSDLGAPPRAALGADVGMARWHRFLRDLGRGGRRATVVVPRDVALLPPGLASVADMVAWDRAGAAKRLPATTGEPRVGMDVDPVTAVDDPHAFPDRATATLVAACALAARVEPNLLRALRLAIGPPATVATEARVWLGPWTDERAATGLVVRRELREPLLRRLLDDRPLLRRLWAVVEAAHVDAPAAIRFEEALAYHWLVGDDVAARGVLRSMVATLVDPHRSGVWRWASAALVRLPRDLMRFEEARMLALGTAVRSGQAADLRHLPRGTGGAWNWLEPSASTTEIAVTLRFGTIEFGPATAQSAMRMAVPDGAVAIVEITPLDTSDAARDAARPVRINPRRRTLVPVDGDAFELDVIGGGRYVLRGRPARRSTQKFVNRTKAVRVHIAYAVESDGVVQDKELPFVIGVMADLAGRRSTASPALEDRMFVTIDVDNFDAVMARIAPRVRFDVPDTIDGGASVTVDLTFGTLDAFLPAAIARGLPAAERLLVARQRLQDLRNLIDRSQAMEEMVDALLDDRTLRADSQVLAPTGSGEPLASAVGTRDWDDLQLHGTKLPALLQRHLGQQRGTDAWPTFRNGLETLTGRSASATGSSPGAAASIEAAIASIDRRLAAQINPVLHHPDLQALEGTWRGLRFLVERTPSDHTLKIRVLDLTKNEARRLFREGPRDATRLHQLIVEREFGTFGGEPYGCLVGDYAFDHGPDDVQLLTHFAALAAEAQAPLIAGVSPGLLDLQHWADLANPRDLAKPFGLPAYAAWRALRERDDARYIGLALPRFLARVPYGARTDPQEAFDFEEEIEPATPASFVWSNAAFAMAANVSRAFAEYGWVARIRGFEDGGLIEGLPVHAFPNDYGDVDVNCPTEIAINDRREAELAKLGLLALMHRKNSDSAAFLGAQSLHSPEVLADVDATFHANLAARLPYVFATCRFTQYVKTLARDRIGSFVDAASLADHVNRWIAQYVDPASGQSSEQARAHKPLAAGEIKLGSADGSWIDAHLAWQPHYQLDGLTAPLGVTTKLPFAGRVARTAAAPPEGA